MVDAKKLLQESIQAYQKMIQSVKWDDVFLALDPSRLPRQTGILFGLSKWVELWDTKAIDKEIMSIKDEVLWWKDLYKTWYGIGLVMTISIIMGDKSAMKDIQMLIGAVWSTLPVKK